MSILIVLSSSHTSRDSNASELIYQLERKLLLLSFRSLNVRPNPSQILSALSQVQK